MSIYRTCIGHCKGGAGKFFCSTVGRDAHGPVQSDDALGGSGGDGANGSGGTIENYGLISGNVGVASVGGGTGLTVINFGSIVGTYYTRFTREPENPLA
jgi:hypothetical protein